MTKVVDVAVVGAGIAGPIAGAYLAKDGLKTVVFEASDQVGGLAWGTYRKGGFHSEYHMHLPGCNLFRRHAARWASSWAFGSRIIPCIILTLRDRMGSPKCTGCGQCAAWCPTGTLTLTDSGEAV